MKFVIVTWYDAYSLDAWFSEVELRDKIGLQPKGELTHSGGFLFMETEEVIAIIQSWNGNIISNETIAGVLVIPKAMVKEIEVVKE